MPAQQALNHVNSMLTTRYREWYLALAGLPQWGKIVDAQVQRYVQGVQDVVRANLEWRCVFFHFYFIPFLDIYLHLLLSFVSPAMLSSFSGSDRLNKLLERHSHSVSHFYSCAQ